MKVKHQLAIWKLLLVFHLISIILFPCIEAPERFRLPRLFVFYYWKMFDFAEQGMLIANSLMTYIYPVTSFILLRIPAFEKTRTPPTVVRWVLILGVVYCCIDLIGCLISVPKEYHPYFSVIMDCLIAALSVWTIKTVNK